MPPLFFLKLEISLPCFHPSKTFGHILNQFNPVHPFTPVSLIYMLVLFSLLHLVHLSDLFLSGIMSKSVIHLSSLTGVFYLSNHPLYSIPHQRVIISLLFLVLIFSYK